MFSWPIIKLKYKSQSSIIWCDDMMVNMGTVDLYWLQNSIEFMD